MSFGGPNEVGVRIQDAVTLSDGKGKYTAYVTEIELPRSFNAPPYTIHRRYREFLDLYNNLCGVFGKAQIGVPFPNRSFGGMGSSLVKHRKEALQAFLDDVTSSRIGNHKLVKTFLEHRPGQDPPKPVPKEQNLMRTPQAAQTAPPQMAAAQGMWGQPPPQMVPTAPPPNRAAPTHQGTWGQPPPQIPPTNQGMWGQPPPQMVPSALPAHQGMWGQPPPQIPPTHQGMWGQPPPQTVSSTPPAHQGMWGQPPPQIPPTHQGMWGQPPPQMVPSAPPPNRAAPTHQGTWGQPSPPPAQTAAPQPIPKTAAKAVSSPPLYTAAPTNQGVENIMRTETAAAVSTATPAVSTARASAGPARPQETVHQDVNPVTPATAAIQWQCTACTFANSGEGSQCDMCKTPRAGDSTATVAVQNAQPMETAIADVTADPSPHTTPNASAQDAAGMTAPRNSTALSPHPTPNDHPPLTKTTAPQSISQMVPSAPAKTEAPQPIPHTAVQAVSSAPAADTAAPTAPTNLGVENIMRTETAAAESTTTPAVSTADTAHPQGTVHQDVNPVASAAAASQWQCTACTFANSGEGSQCDMCKTSRAGDSTATVAVQNAQSMETAIADVTTAPSPTSAQDAAGMAEPRNATALSPRTTPNHPAQNPGPMMAAPQSATSLSPQPTPNHPAQNTGPMMAAPQSTTALSPHPTPNYPAQNAAPMMVAPQSASAPLSPIPSNPTQNALDLAIRILNHGVGPYPPCWEAVRLLRPVAEQGNHVAMCALAMCLFIGRGVKVNWIEAKQLCREAVAKGNVEAAGLLAIYDRKYRPTAPPALLDAVLARWRERAHYGHADAQKFFGYCFLLGVGVAKVHAEAVRWFQLSANQGCAGGQYGLAACYLAGFGVGKNHSMAFQLFQLAANQGSAGAMWYLGTCYDWGYGTPKNQAEAVRLYQLSASLGSPHGQRALGLCYQKGIVVKQDLVEARRFLTAAADQGHFGLTENAEEEYYRAGGTTAVMETRLSLLAAGTGQPVVAASSLENTDFFISHTQRNGLATTLATELYSTLKEEGVTTWFDVKMDDRSTAAMQKGVENSKCVIAVITGPCENPDCPGDSPESNAYFARPYCVSELRWALAAGIKIQPVIRAADKTKIGELMSQAPDDLRFLTQIDFITLDRSDNDYWTVGVKKLMKRIGKTPTKKSGAAVQGGVVPQYVAPTPKPIVPKPKPAPNPKPAPAPKKQPSDVDRFCKFANDAARVAYATRLLGNLGSATPARRGGRR